VQDFLIEARLAVAMLSDLRDTIHVWYDFICPFCYVGQQRTGILANAGLKVVELPFQAHPEIPIEGVAAPHRAGPMYELLESEAAEAGLPLNWPPRLPNSRLALTAAEWTRRHAPDKFGALHRSLFEAHFVSGEDLGDPETIDQHLSQLGIDPTPLWQAVEDGTAEHAVAAAEAAARGVGVGGTPAWLIGGRLINGLLPAASFEELAGKIQQAAI
jgi:predicted DsbA family dithiol-disulfide isomerase